MADWQMASLTGSTAGARDKLLTPLVSCGTFLVWERVRSWRSSQLLLSCALAAALCGLARLGRSYRWRSTTIYLHAVRYGDRIRPAEASLAREDRVVLHTHQPLPFHRRNARR
jgi:hypothetical protein